jgi:peptide/nickel transport system permease protein
VGAWRTVPGGAKAGLALLGGLIAVAVSAAWIAPLDPFAFSGHALRAPEASHPFGTDDLGRDVFAGVVHGTSVSLLVGFTAAALSAAVGIAVGGLAGLGGRADVVLMRFTEFAQAVPRFFLVITLVSLFGGRLSFIVAALGLTAWPSTARIFRAQVSTLMNRDFAAASYAAGAHPLGVLVRHVVPLALPVLGAQIAFQAGGAILAEAGLSFLGLGDPTVMSWGAQLGSAQRFVREAWWMSVFPGLGITITVLACNLLSDAVGARTAAQHEL